MSSRIIVSYKLVEAVMTSESIGRSGHGQVGSPSAVHPEPSVGNASTIYTIADTYPVGELDATRTVASVFLGPTSSDRILRWYQSYHRIVLAFSCTAKILGFASWHYPHWFDHNLAFLLLVVGLIGDTFTILLLNVSLLHLLTRHDEFWFSTALNLLLMSLLAVEVGDLRVLTVLLAAISNQVILCLDADVLIVRDTAISSLLGWLCMLVIGFIGLRRNFELESQPSTPASSTEKVLVNIILNAALTLAVFIMKMSFKRRSLLGKSRRRNQSLIPLAICRRWMTIEPSNPNCEQPTNPDQQVKNDHPVDAPHSSVVPFTPNLANERKEPAPSARSPIKRLIFHKISMCRTIDAKRNLVPSCRLRAPLSKWRAIFSLSCGMMGLNAAGIIFSLILLFDLRDRQILIIFGILSWFCTVIFCFEHAINYQHDIVLMLLRSFDFWFLTVQMLATSVCFADLLCWDIRYLCISVWIVWFVWALSSDALLPSTRAHFKFKKSYATPVLLGFFGGTFFLFYALYFVEGGALLGRQLQFISITNQLNLTINTKTFLSYRLVTIILWSWRLVYAFCFRPDHELATIKGSIALRHPHA